MPIGPISPIGPIKNQMNLTPQDIINENLQRRPPSPPARKPTTQSPAKAAPASASASAMRVAPTMSQRKCPSTQPTR